MTTREAPPRPSREQIFRSEAIAHHARGRTAGRVFDLKDRTAAWAFTVMTAALAVVVAVGLLVEVDQSASGRVVVPAKGSEAIVLLPVGTTPRLRAGLAVELVVGGRTIRTTLISVRGSLSVADANRKYGVRAAAPAVVEARATLPAGSRSALRPGTSTGVAVVVLARRTLVSTLLTRT